MCTTMPCQPALFEKREIYPYSLFQLQCIITRCINGISQRGIFIQAWTETNKKQIFSEAINNLGIIVTKCKSTRRADNNHT